MKFLTIKKRSIIVVLLCILAIGAFCASYYPIKASTSPKLLHTIVIDAGLMSRKDSMLFEKNKGKGA